MEMNSTKQYIEEAKKISELSDDPSTKVGCVIAKDGKIVGESFNH
jgi:deoxycytidylate deaminase